jgi:putative lipoic acid-binding regulatory protein
LDLLRIIKEHNQHNYYLKEKHEATFNYHSLDIDSDTLDEENIDASKDPYETIDPVQKCSNGHVM